MEQNTNNQNNNQSNQLMDPNNRKVATIAGVILVIVVLGALLAGGRLAGNKEAVKEEAAVEEKVALPEGCEPGYDFSIVTGEPCPKEEASKKDTSAAPAERERDTDRSGSYEEMMVKYTGRLVLLNDSCKPALATQTFKKDTRVMVANHSGSPLDVKFNDKDVTLRPYHYVTTKLGTVGSFNLNCDGQDVATVTVQ